MFNIPVRFSFNKTLYKIWHVFYYYPPEYLSFTVFGMLSVPITSDNRESNAVKITNPDLKISF